MTATASGSVNTALALIAAVVILSIVLGVVDLVRLPGWAWRAAGEPKLLSLMLVLLLPGVGLAIYVFGARPKVVAVAEAGRAANLPFERFGDRQAVAVESTRAIQALSLPTTLGSFGEPRPNRAVQASGPAVVAPTGGGFFEDPDVITVHEATKTLEPAPSSAPQAVPGAEPSIHIPGSLGRPYHPRQRTSFEGGESLASVAAQILGATQELEADAPAAPTRAPGGPARAPAPAFAYRPASPGPSAPTTTRLATAGVAAPGSPEIFRPRPDTVAPLEAAGPSAVATVAPVASLAARWLPDPTGRHQYRYWDGGVWTENVYDAGVESRDAGVG